MVNALAKQAHSSALTDGAALFDRWRGQAESAYYQ